MQFFYTTGQKKPQPGQSERGCGLMPASSSSRRYVFVASRMDTELVLDGSIRVGHRLEITPGLETVGMGHLVTHRVIAARDTGEGRPHLTVARPLVQRHAQIVRIACQGARIAGVVMRVTWIVRRLVRQV